MGNGQELLWLLPLILTELEQSIILNKVLL
jgi:hypothetical protein